MEMTEHDDDLDMVDDFEPVPPDFWLADIPTTEPQDDTDGTPEGTEDE